MIILVVIFFAIIVLDTIFHSWLKYPQLETDQKVMSAQTIPDKLTNYLFLNIVSVEISQNMSIPDTYKKSVPLLNTFKKIWTFLVVFLMNLLAFAHFYLLSSSAALFVTFVTEWFLS